MIDQMTIIESEVTPEVCSFKIQCRCGQFHTFLMKRNHKLSHILHCKCGAAKSLFSLLVEREQYLSAPDTQVSPTLVTPGQSRFTREYTEQNLKEEELDA